MTFCWTDPFTTPSRPVVDEVAEGALKSFKVSAARARAGGQKS
jgi:hypothetical protein